MFGGTAATGDKVNVFSSSHLHLCVYNITMSFLGHVSVADKRFDGDKGVTSSSQYKPACVCLVCRVTQPV